MKKILKKILAVFGISFGVISTHEKAKSASSFVSFKNALPEILKLYTPENIIEFGPGFSTEVFLDHTKANILSFESHEKWFQKYSKHYNANKRVQIIKQNQNLDFLNHINSDLKTLVFVDGSNRPETIFHTSKQKNIICIVHDAHRDDYYWSLTHFDHLILLEPHCVVVWNGNLLGNEVATLSQDLSISSRYCEAEYRKAYQKLLLNWDKKTRNKFLLKD